MAEKRWYIWVVGVGIAACLVSAGLFLKDLHPLGTLSTAAPANALSGIAVQFKGATIQGWSGGSKRWSINSKQIQIGEDRRLVTFDGVAQGKLFEKGKTVASISGDRITYNTVTQDVFAPKPIVVKFAGGPSLRAATAYWNFQKSKLLIDRGIDLHIAGSAVHGDAAEADFHSHEIHIRKLKGEFNLDQTPGGI